MKISANVRAGLGLALGTAIVLTLSACADNQQQPLIFVSRDVYGVSIDTSPSPDGTVGLTLGYTGEDFSVVPVTVMSEDGTELFAVRGCYSAADGPHAVSCVPSPWAGYEDGMAQSTEQQPTSTGDSGGVGAQGAAGLSENIFSSYANQIPSASVFVGGNEADSKTDDFEQQALSGKDQKQVMHDSLSVYSSFDSAVEAGGEQNVGVTLGKVFATGVAAQQLTEGQNYYLQFKGRADYAGAVAACVTAAKDAVGGSVSADIIRSCAGRPIVVSKTSEDGDGE